MSKQDITAASVHPSAIVAEPTVLDPSVRIAAFAVIGEENESPVVLSADVIIGPHATVLPGVRVGRGSEVLPNSLVGDDVPPHAVVGGCPAVIVGYRLPIGDVGSPPLRASDLDDVTSTRPVGSARLVRLQSAMDLRGSLVAGEFADLPFRPQRFFTVYGVQSGKVRGEHAHRRCEQLLICVHGTVRCIVDDGVCRREVVLDTPTVGLHLPAMTWGTQYAHSPDAVLVVLASLPYDHDDYIRDYEEYLEIVEHARPVGDA